MKNITKTISLSICFVVASACLICALIGGVSLDNTMKEVTNNITYVVDYSRWFIAIIVLACIILFMAVVGLLFSIPNGNSSTNRSAQIAVLVVTGLAAVTTLVILGYMTCDNSAFLYDAIVDEAYGLDGTSVRVVEDSLCAISNILYRNSMVLVFIASLAIVAMPIINLTALKQTETEEYEAEEDEQEVASVNQELDENVVIKNEIEKLKKQLELEELKEEYKSLYLKANTSKLSKTSETTNEE